MLKRQTARFSGVKSDAELKDKLPMGRHGGPGFFNESLIADVLKALGLSQSKFDAANQSLAPYAKAQSIKVADYKKALLAAQTSELNQLVKDGKMTKKQATEIKSRLTEEYKDAKRYDDLPDRGDHSKRGDHGPGGVLGDSTSAILKALGLDEAKFEAAEQSLPEFAEANKIAYADFEKAVLTAQTAAIDQQVKDGKLTDKQAKHIKEHIQSRADEASSYDDLKKGPERDGHGRGHGHGPDGDMGPGAPDQGTDADPNASDTSVDLAI
jgi:polyhydroxyalkanoate synthesis regulator phasin